MLSVLFAVLRMLNVVNKPFMLNVILLNVILLNVILLNVILLSVVAPFQGVMSSRVRTAV